MGRLNETMLGLILPSVIAGHAPKPVAPPATSNLARHEAYRGLLERGFRTDIKGVAMHRENVPGYNRPGVFLIDDWG